MDNLKKLRESKHYSQEQMSQKLGVARSTISMWENGKSQPDNDALIRIAEFFDTTLDYLVGRDSSVTDAPPAGQNWVPVKGEVRAGIPIDTIEDTIDWEQLTPEMARNGTHIGLKVVGDSMEPRIRAGDVVIVHIQPDIESGEIGIVIINGDTATVKKVIKSKDGLMLVALNPSYEPKFFTNKEIETLPVRIFGKVVELRAKF